MEWSRRHGLLVRGFLHSRSIQLCLVSKGGAFVSDLPAPCRMCDEIGIMAQPCLFAPLGIADRACPCKQVGVTVP